MKKLSILLGATGLLLLNPLMAQAAKLSLAGQVALTTSLSPVRNARITVTFYGHEVGIREYTTEHTVSARTDASGHFRVETKVPDRRYTWTHATVEIAETEVSKQVAFRSACQVDDQGGCQYFKRFRVSPIQPSR